MSVDSTSFILIIVLIAVLLALVLALIAFIRANKAMERTDRDRIDSIAKATINMYMGFEGGQKIRNLVHEELLKQQAKSTTPDPVVPKTDPVVEHSQTENTEPVLSAEDKPCEPQNDPAEIILPTPVTLFTGSYSTGAFRHITPVPDEKTVFVIYTDSADAMEGVLNIDESAYAKVAQTPDYLRNACSYSGTGTQIRVIQTGKVVKEKGSWVVKEPIVAELN